MHENAGNMKENNQERIFNLLRRQGSLTKQEIGTSLGLSMPTTLANVNELMEQGILEEGEAIESTGGRRARKIQVNGKSGFCVGIDITTSQVGFAVTNLMGEVVAKKSMPLKFQDEPKVYEQIGGGLEQVIKRGRFKNKLLGVGISFPGIIDMQAERIVQSHIFGLEYVSLDRFHKIIPYPIIVENDANCLSFVELKAERSDYVYISLNRTVGGAIIQKGQLMTGDGFRTGEIGHMVLVPGGRICYCGKKGCADAYLSPNVLSEEAALDVFFARLQEGEEETAKVWDRYLEHLAILATNLRMALDMEIVIGGEVGAYLEPYMNVLRKKASEYDKFARDIDYLHSISASRREHTGALGASLLALEVFGSSIIK